ncbi:DUF4037 domain-containing protein [Clostridium guangxiense]|uniref:DUF4037 domain-containing protein n=1 Tax=Clostridium guangxiense TaxID=1662055 RepID=UPI001E611C8C|nr:DUF4037 domain-containing protein [Clostridium guangxiense]MCD2347083.1 DUF4037 domain-containing protein [Clostridium guangxiense]
MIRKIDDLEMNNDIIEMLNDFSELKEVEGILLAGSRAVKTNDKFSDYDVYVYLSKDISVDERRKITDKYCSYMELDNRFWETEDDGTLKEGNVQVEIIYRNLDWINDSLDRTIVKCEADTGYTTCFWSNIKNSVILYDKAGKLNKLQDECAVPYPKELKENILKKNYPLLKSKMPAYYYQIEKALKRDDFISVNHRIAAFFASYFDIIFAVNEMLHPGEKKLLKIIRERDLRVPVDMDLNVGNILKFSAAGDFKILEEIDLLINNLNAFLKKEGLWNEWMK